MEDEKENLIRLLISPDESNFQLALQMNKGLKILSYNQMVVIIHNNLHSNFNGIMDIIQNMEKFEYLKERVNYLKQLQLKENRERKRVWIKQNLLKIAMKRR